jgi:hypothetical protein
MSGEFPTCLPPPQDFAFGSELAGERSRGLRARASRSSRAPESRSSMLHHATASCGSSTGHRPASYRWYRSTGHACGHPTARSQALHLGHDRTRGRTQPAPPASISRERGWSLLPGTPAETTARPRLLPCDPDHPSDLRPDTRRSRRQAWRRHWRCALRRLLNEQQNRRDG